MSTTVSKAVSVYFYDQICGDTNGHMAAIPNNPVLGGLMAAHGVESRTDFAEFLKQVVDNLQE